MNNGASKNSKGGILHIPSDQSPDSLTMTHSLPQGWRMIHAWEGLVLRSQYFLSPEGEQSKSLSATKCWAEKSKDVKERIKKQNIERKNKCKNKKASSRKLLMLAYRNAYKEAKELRRDSR